MCVSLKSVRVPLAASSLASRLTIIIIIITSSMTYNQVQSFQINDYANHYVDIELTGCCTANVLQAGM